METIYTMTKEQFDRLDTLLTHCFEFAQGIKAEGVMTEINKFDVEVFDEIRVNQKRQEE